MKPVLIHETLFTISNQWQYQLDAYLRPIQFNPENVVAKSRHNGTTLATVGLGICRNSKSSGSGSAGGWAVFYSVWKMRLSAVDRACIDMSSFGLCPDHTVALSLDPTHMVDFRPTDLLCLPYFPTLTTLLDIKHYQVLYNELQCRSRF